MAQPLRSEGLPHASNLQFTHFGVLDAGAQSKASVLTSATINIVAILLAISLGVAAKKMNDSRPRVAELVAPINIKPAPEIIKPRVVPPLPQPPKIQVQPPRITVPIVKAPEMPTPAVVKMTQPAPVIAPAPPKRVIAPAAPAVVSLAHPSAASVVNNSAHPSAVALGRADNPIAPSNAPATAAVNLGSRGLAGMPAGNTGSGPPAARVSLGSGSPGGTALAGNGVRPVAGIKLGIPGGTGPANAVGRVAGPVNLGATTGQTTNPGRAAGPVNLGVATVPAMPKPPVASASVHVGPKVVYKPRPEYTSEARALHLEGTVSVRLRVSASGTVQVLGVSNGLGHGLDQSAENAVRGTRFQPAMDAAGHPIDWEGVVNVAFQLAG